MYFNFSLIIQNIVEMPIGEGLETPLHPKRIHLWQPSQTAPAPEPPASSIIVGNPTSASAGLQPPAAMSPSSAVFMEYREAEPSTPPRPLSQSLASEIPSPAMFVECGQSAPSTPTMYRSPPTVRPRCSRQILDENEIAALLNLGSDGS